MTDNPQYTAPVGAEQAAAAAAAALLAADGWTPWQIPTCRYRMIREWLRTPDGRQCEQWAQGRWDQIRAMFFPEARMENGWWRLTANRKYRLREEDWRWGDFAEEGGDNGLVLLLITVHGEGVIEELADEAKDAATWNWTIPTWQPIPDDMLSKENGRTYWVYRDLDGAAIAHRRRGELEGGGKRFWNWARTCGHWEEEDGVRRWVEGSWKGNIRWTPKLRPLYGSDLLAERWVRVVSGGGILIVEGEKTCCAAQAKLDASQRYTDWVAVSPGPSGHYGSVDMDLVRGIWGTGRRVLDRQVPVIIVPDHDTPGRKAARKLQGRGVECGENLYRICTLGADEETGWDLADLEDDMDAWMDRAVESSLLLGQRVATAKAGERVSIAEPENGFVYVEPPLDTYVRLRDMKEFSAGAIDRLFGTTGSKGKMSRVIADGEDTPKVSGYSFAPGAPLLFMDGEGRAWINSWAGYGTNELEKDEEPEVDWWKEHLEYLIPERAYRQEIEWWLARIVQNPERRNNHAVILQGAHGTGKSFIGAAMQRLLGRRHCVIKEAAELMSKWNRDLQNCCLVVGEELHRSSRRDHLEFSNRMKHWITSDSIRVEEKGIQPFDVPNYVNFFFITNYHDSIAIDEGDDRYFVYFSSAKKRTEAYYRELWGRLNTHSADLLTYLLRLEIPEGAEKKRAQRTRFLDQLMFETKENPLGILLERAYNDKEEPFADKSGRLYDSLVMSDVLQYVLFKLPSGVQLRGDHLSKNIGAVLRDLGYIKQAVDARSYRWFHPQAVKKAVADNGGVGGGATAGDVVRQQFHEQLAKDFLVEELKEYMLEAAADMEARVKGGAKWANRVIGNVTANLFFQGKAKEQGLRSWTKLKRATLDAAGLERKTLLLEDGTKGAYWKLKMQFKTETPKEILDLIREEEKEGSDL